MKIHWIITVLPFWAMLWQGRLAAHEAGCRAQLESRLEGDKLTLIGHCQNAGTQPLTLRYELLTDKKGKSGTSRNAQSGNFTVAPQQTATLSQTTINVAPADFYRVQLRVLDLQGTLVAQDSLVHQPGSRP
ncbi:curli-like amyloid fiber formation chaperone CsgH [Hymenobacter lucidus]|uniref:CsgH-like domain-containing protein n=1 Tax=Hymenobacter lucidus TaxID=2880930 RepID=A0ABS8AT78_9BACT|nr:curli-like amyloid fiber formation chaperone CsgH [Hymenobacter lucidus]MCB2408986.1 hypothetical protein [Hymenobacter lucidus]